MWTHRYCFSVFQWDRKHSGWKLATKRHKKGAPSKKVNKCVCTYFVLLIIVITFFFLSAYKLAENHTLMSDKKKKANKKYMYMGLWVPIEQAWFQAYCDFGFGSQNLNQTKQPRKCSKFRALTKDLHTNPPVHCWIDFCSSVEKVGEFVWIVDDGEIRVRHTVASGASWRPPWSVRRGYEAVAFTVWCHFIARWAWYWK